MRGHPEFELLSGDLACGTHGGFRSPVAWVALSLRPSHNAESRGGPRCRSAEAARSRFDVAVMERDLRSQLPKSGEVKVDRPDADRAPARERNAHRAGARQQRSQDED